MNLFYRKYGKGHPLIIVHGLYGSSDNWVTIAKILSEYFEVYIIDQRNHGSSPHSKDHNYTLMQNDLLEFMNFHSIESAILMGHSMGGRTVMMFSENYPEKVDKMIVVDVSPAQVTKVIESKQIYTEHQSIVNTMLSVDFSDIKTRSDIDTQLSENISQLRLRQFLLKNVKKEGNSFLWKINIKAIKENLENILIGFNKEFKGYNNTTPFRTQSR